MKEYKIEVLVATMNQKDFSLFHEMKIQTDCIIANQTSNKSIETKMIDDHKLTKFNYNDSGIAQNRNKALLLSEGEILLMSDDDLVYYEDYADSIKKAYNEYPFADAIIFDINLKYGQPIKLNNDVIKVNKLNYARYGAAALSVKKESLKKSNIKFHECFGCSVYGSGEDTIFIHDLLKEKLNIIKYPCVIADEISKESTWFSGYNDKYFFDKGALMSAIYPKSKYFMALVFSIKHGWSRSTNKLKVIKLYLAGARCYDDMINYDTYVKGKKVS